MVRPKERTITRISLHIDKIENRAVFTTLKQHFNTGEVKKEVVPLMLTDDTLELDFKS